MFERLDELLLANREAVRGLLRRYLRTLRPFLLRAELWDGFVSHCATPEGFRLRGSPLEQLIAAAQEAVLDAPWVLMAVRPSVGRWTYLRFNAEILSQKEVPVSEFLALKERLVGEPPDAWRLEVDFGPFGRELPRLQEARSIGRGASFLNRRLAGRLFQTTHSSDCLLLEFLRVHQYQGTQLMLNKGVANVPSLRSALHQAEEYLAKQPREAGWKEVEQTLRRLGFEPGWGNNVARMRETFALLADILEAPDPGVLKQFLARIPMIFNVVILSPHGFFGQSNVLGLPDTGGQVVYILDQVRALEQEMRTRLAAQGLEIDPRIVVITRLIPDAGGTTCNQRLEPIAGTRHAHILRIPFHSKDGKKVTHWISRFDVWPYLERFATDAEREVLHELGHRPDLLIGNYSDGNLVATLLANRLRVTQCNIAHALEKTKYPHADLRWHDSESQYHFSCQFTADLISMNAADFIVASTYQEIAGREDVAGQYENYGAFTLPGLYRVVNGIDVFDPRFNIVSPGTDPAIYFPFTEETRRLRRLQPEIEALIYGPPSPQARGRLTQGDRPLLFTMARLDPIKNVTGLVQWYARSQALRDRADLLVIAGCVDPSQSEDREEQEQVARMHELMNQYDLDGQVRWLGMRLTKALAGELYRFVADRRGLFVQPALFEAFGLTVVEAMISGLPTFATIHGGPLEIIEHGISGFHIDPNHSRAATAQITEFLDRCAADPENWRRISEGAVARIQRGYTWALYAESLMTLARIYGFWKYATSPEPSALRRYLELFYGLALRPRAESLLGDAGP